MKPARYCLEFVNLGGLLRQGEYLRQKQSKVIANNILAKVLAIRLFSHEKCNIFNLSLQINCSKNMPSSIKKQKSLNQAQVWELSA
ncbi:hypothetical protein J5D27_05465 [Helicobacter pylori]|uniref:hypothetical protein n=1 Tax=Helicobacter pylori TaxID=210 RepID=UPI001AEA63C1|nr:hypothetical protein [Helicobacter pylori]QTO97984.1 hypothetical protein J5D20_05610 [Helicobacter pylori]QTP00882.1 hypothetical protein J5D27_05465 [Helicobacter pylori]